MKNKNNDMNKILFGIVIGGIAGGSVFYLLHSLHNKKQPFLDRLGRTICNIGEILESSGIDDQNEAIEEIENSLPKGDHAVNNALNWIATGIHLWKNIKKGRGS